LLSIGQYLKNTDLLIGQPFDLSIERVFGFLPIAQGLK